MTREAHPPLCPCCVAYEIVLELFNSLAPDGQIDLFIDGILQSAAHISAAQTKDGCFEAQSAVLQDRLSRFYDFYLIETGKITKQ